MTRCATVALLLVALLVGAPSAASAQDAPNKQISPLDLPIDKPVRGRALQDPNQPEQPPEAPEPEPEPDPVAEEPPTFFGEEIEAPTDAIIYVVDRSNSMHQKVGPFVGLDGNVIGGGNRFDRARVALKRSIADLSDNFTFNIVFYDHCIYIWKPARVEANDENKAQAFAFLDSVRPNVYGWTNIGLATYAALEDKENKTVVLLTDGSPNYLDCNKQYMGDTEVHRALIRFGNTQGAKIHTFAIGAGAEASDFMRDVAADHGGTFTEIN